LYNFPAIFINQFKISVENKSNRNKRGIFKINRQNREGYSNRLEQMGNKEGTA
jgi:hypothetical protein